MSRNGHGSNVEEALAREAKPLRRWLLSYFRQRAEDEVDVEDMVQDVFARIVARDSLAPIDHLGGYVLQTAASVFADRFRRRSARRADAHVEFDPDQHADQDFDPERLLSGKQELNRVNAVLLALPERTRNVFILHQIEGQKYREIAAGLGISVSAVEKQMVRAIQHLARHAGKRHGS